MKSQIPSGSVWVKNFRISIKILKENVWCFNFFLISLRILNQAQKGIQSGLHVNVTKIAKVCVSRCFLQWYTENILLELNYSFNNNLHSVKFELVENEGSLRPCGAMDNASAYGAEDSRFESWQGRYFRLFSQAVADSLSGEIREPISIFVIF